MTSISFKGQFGHLNTYSHTNDKGIANAQIAESHTVDSILVIFDDRIDIYGLKWTRSSIYCLVPLPAGAVV